MKQVELFSDLSALTGISKLSFEKLADTSISCISHALFEAIKNKQNQCEIDIGLGILYIRMESNAIKYKFLPNKKFEDRLALTATNQVSSLILEADLALGERIQNAYNSLL